MIKDTKRDITMAEIMGKEATSEGITMQNLPKILGNAMPKLEYSPAGKMRLIQALHNRFGEGFKNIPGVKELLNEFDKELLSQILIAKNGGK